MSKEDFKNATSLRKEFSGLQAVKDYNNVLPILIGARNAPDDGAGDLAIIYAAGKILDPGSAIKDGELTLTIGTGSPEERVQGFVNFVRGNGGRLPPGMRKKLLVMLNERALAYRNLHDQARGSFSNYAKAIGLDPSVVVGQHPADAMKGINPGVFGRQPVTERVNKYLEQGAR